MTDKDIISRIRELIQEETKENKPLQMAGTLTHPQGPVKGFLPAPVGTAVFIRGDRWVIFLESIDGNTALEIPYYPETLMKVVDQGKAL